MRDRATLRLTLILAALLSACGGGSSSNSASTASATADAPATIILPGPIVQPGPIGPIVQPAPIVPPAPLPGAQPNPEGAALTFSSSGTIDRDNPFFKALGNGRSCATCHQQAEGWSVTPQGLQARFAATQGEDPVFRLVDGANSPLAPVATIDQKRLAYSMLLTKGLIRVGLPLPADAQFTLARVDDPYNHASATEVSLFRRPMPSANLKFAASVMWDGRETFRDAASSSCIAGAQPVQCFSTLDFNLLHQANSALRGHAEAAQDLSAAEQRAIVDFETGLFHAQTVSATAGSLLDGGALGGPARLATQAFYFGINDVEAGDYLSGAPFERAAFTLFGAWRNSPDPARAAVARGEGLFNNRPMTITQVAGFSDTLRLPLQRGTCTSCHNAPNSGSHSVARLFNTGVAAGALRTPDMPLYTLRNNATGETVDTTDPGSAMLSGRWDDIGKFKTPNLRGASARAPYFHDGSAPNLEAVVRFYERRFRMGLNAQEMADLAAFLKAL